MGDGLTAHAYFDEDVTHGVGHLLRTVGTPNLETDYPARLTSYPAR